MENMPSLSFILFESVILYRVILFTIISDNPVSSYNKIIINTAIIYFSMVTQMKMATGMEWLKRL